MGVWIKSSWVFGFVIDRSENLFHPHDAQRKDIAMKRISSFQRYPPEDEAHLRLSDGGSSCGVIDLRWLTLSVLMAGFQAVAPVEVKVVEI